MKLKLAVVAMLTLASGAEAASFKFAYQLATGTISGRFAGSLQADGNTVFLDSFGFARFNGVEGAALPLLTTASGIYGEYRQPRASFNGSGLDFAACSDENCADGVLFDPDVIDTAPIVSLGSTYGDTREYSAPGQWSLTAVPEPASWLLMLAGFGIVGWLARQRSAAVTA